MTPAYLEQRIAALEIIADWRDELQSKIRRAILRFEASMPRSKRGWKLRVETFNQICHCLAGAGREAIPQREAA